MVTSKYFKEAEFKRCTPSCSLQDMKQSSVDRMDRAREIAGIPFVINCAYRSPAWEKACNRSEEGSHPHGCAWDIRCNTSTNRMKIVAALLEAGYTRIGIGKNYIHADDDPTKPQNVMWHYYE